MPVWDSGEGGAAEAEQWVRDMWSPGGLHELHQLVLTHCSGLARSRLGRAYNNHALVNQLDRDYFCLALPPTGLSHHRPISFGRRGPVNFRTGPGLYLLQAA